MKCMLVCYLLASVLSFFAFASNSKPEASSINGNVCEGKAPLLIAVENGDLDLIKSLIIKGADVNIAGVDDMTPLHMAVIYGVWRGNEEDMAKGLAMAKILLENSADRNKQDNHGKTPLHWCILTNFKQMFNLMLLGKEGKNILADKGKTQLEWSVSTLYAKRFYLLPYQKYDGMNIRDEKGRTLLHFAVYSGDKEMVEDLIELGADRDSRDNEGLTPLYWAVLHYQPTIAKILIEKGAKTNLADEEGITPLHLAAINGDSKIARIIIQEGGFWVDVNLRDKEGRAPLHWAAMNGDSEIVNFLLQRSAYVNIQDLNGFTPLHLAVKHGQVITCQILRIWSTYPHYRRDIEGKTELHWAAITWNTSIFQILLDNDNLDIKDNNGLTPIDYIDINAIRANDGRATSDIDTISQLFFKAAGIGNAKLCKRIIDIGVNMDLNFQSSSGFTPLHQAAREGHLKVCKILIENGADLNIPNFEGDTPLHTTVLEDKPDIYSELIENGADWNITNNDGKTPIELLTWIQVKAGLYLGALFFVLSISLVIEIGHSSTSLVKVEDELGHLAVIVCILAAAIVSIPPNRLAI